MDTGYWIEDSGQWREMGNGGKQTWKRVRGREKEDQRTAPKKLFSLTFVWGRGIASFLLMSLNK